MADIKVNEQTGELAVPQQDNTYRIYKKGEYKFNAETGQYAVPEEGGGWKLYQHEKKGGFLPMSRDIEGNLGFDPSAGILGSIISGFKAPGDVASGELKLGDPEFEKRLMDTTGLMLGGNPMVTSGERAIPGALKNLRPGPVKIPTAQELKAAGGAAYDQAEAMGVDYSSQSVKSLAEKLLQTKGVREKSTPATFDILSEISKPPKDSVVNLTGLRDIRSALADIAGDMAGRNKSERRAATVALRELDKFLEEPPLSSAVVGAGVSDGGTAVTPATGEAFNEAVKRLQDARSNAADAGKLIKEANANYAAGERSNTVTALERKAERRAGASNSGTNVDNQIRSKFASFLEKPKETRGYSPEELALAEKIAVGTKGANVARYTGNMLGGGGGVMSNIPAAIGAAVGSPLGPLGAAAGAAIPLTAGFALRQLASTLTKKEVRLLNEMVRKRSPLFMKALESPQMVPQSPELGMATNRGLMFYRPEEQR